MSAGEDFMGPWSPEELWRAVDAVSSFPEKEKTKEMFFLMLEALRLFSKKQHDYSTLNIAACGEEGLFTRITDKYFRLFSHYRMGKEMENEPVEDTWLDLGIYSFIALLVRRGKWVPTEEEKKALGLV